MNAGRMQYVNSFDDEKSPQLVYRQTKIKPT